ncbi:calcium-dependent protein kinase [Trifolium repens]|nr:calcium-dependent protein kinase [Trifolium repens]
MVKHMKFVYAMTLLVSIFLVAANFDAIYECDTDPQCKNKVRCISKDLAADLATKKNYLRISSFQENPQVFLKNFMRFLSLRRSSCGSAFYRKIRRLNGKEVELTPVVSQMTGPITLSLFASDTAEDLVYPPELNVFVEKKMLFKGEVSDANLFHNWHGYIVKKLTENENITSFRRDSELPCHYTERVAAAVVKTIVEVVQLCHKLVGLVLKFLKSYS